VKYPGFFRWVFGHPLKTSLFVLVTLAGAGLAFWGIWTTTQLLRRGEEALAARNYPAARDYLARYLGFQPGDARARLLAARTFRRLGEYYQAREHLQRCRKDGGDPETIEVEDALIDVQRGDERPVEKLRERAGKDDELALVVLEVLIQHDLDTTQHSKALDGLNRYLARKPDDLQALLGRAFVWERSQNFKDALGDYQKAVAAHPENERARLLLADTLLVVGTPSEALTQYQWLAERYPLRPEVRLGLARCRRQLGQGEEARKLLDDLLAENPDKGAVLWERGQVDLEDGKPAQAEPWLQRAAKQLPCDRRVHFSLYRCLVELKRSAEAEPVKAHVARLDADLRRLIQVRQQVMKNPNNVPLRCEGGKLFLRNGEYKEGIRWLQLALRLDPHCEEAHKALAEAETKPGP